MDCILSSWNNLHNHAPFFYTSFFFFFFINLVQVFNFARCESDNSNFLKAALIWDKIYEYFIFRMYVIFICTSSCFILLAGAVKYADSTFAEGYAPLLQ